MGEKSLLNDDIHRLAIFIQYKPRFRRFKVYGALPNAFIQKGIGESLERFEFNLIRMLSLSVQDCLYLFIGKPLCGTYDRLFNREIDDIAVGCHLHKAAEGQLVFIRAEAAYAVGEMLRQHSDHAVYKIDARAPPKRFLIQNRFYRRVRSEERRVGNM